ncbi:ACT domain-containing protein [Tepidibacter aestuarii]|uniref:ACT domain-containing protein n=1 Tax=Tepidibacter aestuarii TaxID=2925782 RepID=UPI0020C16F42|nr:ACT domain-containing protein [Tepidibacter aestuarii]CAH2213036.1 ACT domain-containing protein [Tepidibacter aestuarii]
MKAFVSVIGKDKIGIIHRVTSVLSENGVNILDINQTLLHDYFTMIMFVDLEKMQIDFNELKNKLEDAGNKIDVSIKIQHEDIFNSMHKI